MSETKKTAADYRKDLKCLQDKTQALEARISDRLQKLCERFPEAKIGILWNSSKPTIIKAKSIGSLFYIGTLETVKSLEYIEAIEKWIAEQNPVKQTKINF